MSEDTIISNDVTFLTVRNELSNNLTNREGIVQTMWNCS